MLKLVLDRIKNAVLISTLMSCFFVHLAAAEDEHILGKKITNFAAKVTSVTYLEDRSILNLQTFGDVGPYGTVGVTATFMRPVDGKGTTGPYSSQGISFRSDGAVERLSSHGVWTSLGQHRWQVKAIGISSEGASMLAVGTMELETMSFKGTVYSLD
jgi:hypothetical protein